MRALFQAIIVTVCFLLCANATGSPSVTLVDGTTLIGTRGEGVDSFKGVRYAQPPVGSLRWKPPQLYVNVNNSDKVDATKFGAHCLQDTWPNGSEDCLFLNVYMGDSVDVGAHNLPVVIFFHGGSYVLGASKFYSGADLVSYLSGRVIVVTADYRLNVFGFLGSEELRSQDPEAGTTGNYGIQDQRLAMQWVQQNIGAFGGDAGRVTIMGESAGAGSVSNHLTMPRSWPYFGAAILESGAFSHWVCQPMTRAQSVFEQLLEVTTCADTSCLLQLSADELFAAARTVHMHDGNFYLEPFLPVADGVEAETHPWLALTNGVVADVPVLLGSNSDEGIAMFTTDTVSKHTNMSELLQFWRDDRGYSSAQEAELLQLYLVGKRDVYPRSHIPFVTTPEWWAAQRSTGDVMFSCPVKYVSQQLAVLQESGRRASGAYTYHFARHSFGSVYSIHSSEMQYVFHWRIGQQDDALLADTMASYWGNFVLSPDHDPNGDNAEARGETLLPVWGQYDTSRDNVLLFPNDESVVAEETSGLKFDECSFFVPYLSTTIAKDFAPS